jgi:hypothetical protein
MNAYALSTWMGQQMIEVEDLGAASDAEAIAYASGKLDERHRGKGAALLRIGVCYRLDRQLKDDGLIDLADATRIGDWFSVGNGNEVSLIWAAHHRAKEP